MGRPRKCLQTPWMIAAPAMRLNTLDITNAMIWRASTSASGFSELGGAGAGNTRRAITPGICDIAEIKTNGKKCLL